MDQTPRTPRANTFAGLSLILDRVAEHRDEAEWVQTHGESTDARYLLLDRAGETWLRTGEPEPGLRWLNGTERQRLLPDAPATLLGLIGPQPHFLLTLDEQAQPESFDAALDARRANLRNAGLLLPAAEAGLFAYAKGLAHWQNETRHCAYCGSPLTLVAAGHRAQCGNPTCGRLHFPRTDAAIIVIVEHGDACLLGRQAGWPKGRYSTLAGFVEPGESLEDAVRREVAEESGVIVDEAHYHSSQPWPLPASLMVGFTATAVSREIHLRDRELEEARWFTAQQIVDGLADGSFAPPFALSVSYQLLSHWLARRGLDLDVLVAQVAR